MAEEENDFLGVVEETKKKKNRRGKTQREIEKMSRHAIQHDKWDVEDFERLLAQMPEFDGARDRLCDKVETGNGLTADALWSLLKVEPKLEDPEEVRPNYLIDHAIMTEAMDLSEHRELRSLGTVGDDVAAALGFVTIRPDLEAIHDKLKTEEELAKQLEEQMKEMEKLRQQELDLDQMIKDLEGDDDEDAEEADCEGEGQPGGQGQSQGKEGGVPGKKKGGKRGPRDYQNQKEDLQKKMKDLQKELDEKRRELQKDLEKKRPEIRQAMKEALGKAVDEAQSLQMASDTWGVDPGVLQRMSPTERMELAKRLNTPRMKRIAELFGPMRRLMFSEQRRKVYHARDEVYDVSKGAELDRVLPMEFLYMDDPILELEFYRQYIEESLLQYEMRGEEKVGRGEIIFVEDGSGSMHGEREMWAKAVMLCLLHLARQQKRGFRLIHFGSSACKCGAPENSLIRNMRDGGSYYARCPSCGETDEIFEMKFTAPEDFNLDNVLEAAEIFFGGGTDFERPLNVARDRLKQQVARDGVLKGDIVFVTDGACAVAPAWLDEFLRDKLAMQFKCWGISIGGHPHDQPLYDICNGLTAAASDLVGGENIRDVFGGVGVN